MSILRKFSIFFILCLVGFFLFNSYVSKKPSDPELVVVTSADNPPYEFMQNGKIIGLDIDLAEAVAKKLNKRLILKNVDFPTIIPTLQSNSVDFAIAGLSSTPERAKHIDFSDEYFSSPIAILSKIDRNIKAVKDLANKIIGVQSGTFWEKEIKVLATELPGIKIVSLPNNLLIFEELKNNVIDVMVIEEMQASEFKRHNNSLEILVLRELASFPFAIALPKNSLLTTEINKVVKELHDEGMIKHLREKWLAESEE